ncbi:MAG TPA: DUF881 domain-containing protein [Clostridiaceae bacterium]
MRNNEANIFIFVASIIIGILISMNISFDNSKKATVYLDAKQYQDSYNQRNIIYSDLDNLKTQYASLQKKITNYVMVDKSKEDVVKEIENEIDQNKFLLGLTAVSGPGVRITMNDAEITDFNDPGAINALVHNFDIYFLINDLKNAGAEAISINGQRIVDSSEVYCFHEYLRINGQKLWAPFVIEAIGNQTNIKSYLYQLDKEIPYMEGRGISVLYEVPDKVIIPPYAGDLPNTYLKVK